MVESILLKIQQLFPRMLIRSSPYGIEKTISVAGLLVIWAAAMSFAGAVIWFPPGASAVRGVKVGWADPIDAAIVTSGPGRHTALFSALKFGYLDVNGIQPSQLPAILSNLADSTGHLELKNVPIVTHGMSFSSGHASNFMRSMPARTLATGVVHITGTIQDNDSTICNTPILFKTTTQDFMEAQMQNTLSAIPKGYRQFCAIGSGGHEYADSELLLYPFYQQTFLLRYPEYWDPLSGVVKLKTIAWQDGWLGFADTGFMKPAGPNIVSAAAYSGNLYNSMWLPNEYMATIWRSYMSTGSCISLTSPSMDRDRFARSYDFNSSIEVTASIPTKPYTKVELYDGNFLLGSFTAGPFTVSAKNLGLGAHAFYAKAYLADGNVEISRPVTAVIHGLNVHHDVRIIKPASTERISKSSMVTLEAETWVFDKSTISEVEFFDGPVSIGKATSAPFRAQWSPTAEGSHNVTATAKNALNVSLTSWPVKYTVINQPVATSIQLSPTLALVKPGAQQQFTAVIRDQYNYPFAVQPAVTWGAQGGSISGGNFTAQTQIGSNFKVTASVGAVSVSSTVHVSNTLRFKFAPFGYAFDGFISDWGNTYTKQANGLSYGWNLSTRHARARRVDPQLMPDFTTHISMVVQRDPPWNKSYERYTWEIELPNGKYHVRIGAGDPANRYDIGQGIAGSYTFVTTQFLHKITAEDTLIMNDTGFMDSPSVSKAGVIDLTDGRLTIKRGWTAKDDSLGTLGMTSDNAFRYMRQHTTKICYVEITPSGEENPIGAQLQSPSRSSAGARIKMTTRGAKILLSTDSPITGVFELYTSSGRLLLRKRLFDTGTSIIALSGLARGTFIIKIAETNGHLLTKQVVIR